MPCTSDDLVLYDEPTSVRAPEGRIGAGFNVGRTRDRSELAVFEEIEGRFTARMLRSFEGAPFAEQEADPRSSARTSRTRPRSAGRPTSRSSFSAAT